MYNGLMANKNYYEEKIDQIQNLLKNGKYEEASKTVVEELNMPYIPSQYEQIFNDFNEKIIYMQHKLDKPLSAMSRNEVLSFLFSGEEEKEKIALEMLPEQNLRYMKVELKKAIESWGDDKNIEKAFIFEALVDQEIDIEIEFKKGKKMNPIRDYDVIANVEVSFAMSCLEEIFNKEPSLLEIAKAEFERYLLLSYPLEVKNGKELAFEIAQVVKFMFNANVDLSTAEHLIYQTLQQQ